MISLRIDLWNITQWRINHEDTFRNRARTKKQRDLMPANKKKIFYKKRHENLTESQIKLKQYRDRIYKERLKDS